MADRSSVGTTELEIRDRAIVERVAAGLALRAVGAEYGLSHTKVRRIAARAGVHFLHPGGALGRLTASPNSGSCAARA